jgi:hypothetical protein
MSGVSLLTWLLIVWGAITLAFIGVMGWKSLIGLREEDIVVLSQAEARLVEDQQQLIVKIERLTRWAKTFGFASLGLLLVMGGVWAYRGYLVFTGTATP